MLYAADSTLADISPATTGETTDEELMSLTAQGDERAFATLLKRHASLLRTIISRVINNDADVDDLMQEVSCEVWRQASHYNVEKGKALGWLVTLGRRRAIDKLRKKQAYNRCEERLLNETKFDDAHKADYGDSETCDRTELLERVIATLPIPQQEALKLAFYRGFSQREIARHTGIPLGTIKTRLELAVRKVKSGVLVMGGAAAWS